MKTKLVRYVSPFGSPATMEREEAEKYLTEDEPLWDLLEPIGALTPEQRAVGAPRIEVLR